MKVKEFLTEKNWCKGGYAKNKQGEKVKITNPEAVFFCIVGATAKC